MPTRYLSSSHIHVEVIYEYVHRQFKTLPLTYYMLIKSSAEYRDHLLHGSYSNLYAVL